MGINVIINALTDEQARPLKGASAETLDLKYGWTIKLLGVLQEHAIEEATVQRNERLTHLGKRQALATFATNQTAPKLQWIKNLVQVRTEQDEGYRKKFFSIDSNLKDPAVRMPTYVYLWNALDSLDSSRRVARFVKAGEANDLVVMAAMLENPLGAMIDDDVRERVLTTRAERLFPEAFEDWTQNTFLLDYLRSYGSWVARWLANELGVEIKVVRANLGDEIGDRLTVQRTGLPEPDAQLVEA